MAGTLTGWDAVILAGGAGARMGQVDKPGLEVGGRPMVVTVARAARQAGATQLIVVGPARGGAVGAGLRAAGARLVREDPPGGGPVPALRRGLAEVTGPWLFLLAADLPFLTSGWLTELAARARSAGSRDTAGAVLADADGRLQWLAGCWQADVLRAALAGYPGSSLHGLLAPLQPAAVQLDLPPDGTGRPPWHDCDTPADLAAARHAAAAGGPESGARS